jgi:phage tail protein X
MSSSGTLEKLVIYAYSDPAYSQQVGSPFKAYLNPKPYTQEFKVNYSNKKPAGTSAADIRFFGISAEQVSFEFLFDATGVVPGSSTDLASQIDAFKKVVYDFNSSIHSPNYLKIVWGKFLFKGKLTDMRIEYTFFKPDGTPLRANLKTEFKQFEDASTIAKQEGKESPDLTHKQVVRQGDTLPLMCYRIYGDSTYYHEVARANNMDTFTRLVPGTTIFFPPLRK